MYAPPDTSLEAAEVQRRAFAAMDGFERLHVVARMRARVLALLKFKHNDPEAIVSHLFRHSIPAEELQHILTSIRARR